MSAVVAWSAGLVALAWLGASASIRPRKPRRRTNVKRPQSWLQWWLPVARALLLPFCAAGLLLGVGSFSPGPLAPVFQIVGLLMTPAGLVLASRGAVELGDSFASGVESWNEQELTTKGLFALVRHPIYLGTIALWFGLGLSLLSWLLLAVAAILVIPAFHLLAHLEERQMADRFGHAYQEYQARVPMLFPLPRK